MPDNKTNNRRKRRFKRAFGLNVILWVSFLVFALILIVTFTVIQNFQMRRQYRQTVEQTLNTAGARLKSTLSGEERPDDLTRIMLTYANQYSVNAYLFSEDGEYIFPEGPMSEAEEYKAIYEMVKEQFDGIEEAKRDKAQILFTSKEYASYATLVHMEQTAHYLYLTCSYEQLNTMTGNMLLLSLFTALLSAVLSFVVSGIVSILIAKPVTEVTERAKELARGDYETKFNENYYCIELNELSEALDYASAEISKADKMQKELIANISHDFKTPLTMIKAYAAMIQEISGSDPEKREKHTQIIIDETDRLASLVGDILDLSKIQAGLETYEHTVFNLSEVVYNVVGRFGYLEETQGFTLETHIEEDLYTYACKPRVEQVLYNLIGNACNYTGDDKKVIICLNKTTGTSHFEVIDSGKGISEEERETIWERYYRSSEMHKRPVKGTGLGLSIVKNVLKKNNIPFGVESELGKGSCFWADFPEPPAEEIIQK